MQPGFDKLIDSRSIDHVPAAMGIVPAAFDAGLLTRRPEPSADDLYRHDQPARTKDAIIGRSRALRQVIEQLNLVAATDSTADFSRASRNANPSPSRSFSLRSGACFA